MREMMKSVTRHILDPTAQMCLTLGVLHDLVLCTRTTYPRLPRNDCDVISYESRV
jgi:hypothetical protein